MHETSFRPTIPIAVRRPPRGHLADGHAEAQPQIGPGGFTTHYLAAVTMVGNHLPAELLADEACELVLSTGHTLAGHFYPSPEGSSERLMFVFIPAGS